MGEKRREKKSSCDGWHFRARKVGFSQAGVFFQDFFSQENKGWDVPHCGDGWAVVGGPCCLLHSEQQNRF